MNAVLSGRSVLVLQYYAPVAIDVADALAHAGATVLGPFRVPRDAYRALPSSGVRAAVVGVNFGRGLTAKPALTMLSKGLSVVLHTGYDHQDLPPELKSLPYVGKPLASETLVEAVAKAIGL